MNLDRHETITRWLAYPGDKLEPPTLVRMAYRAERRLDEFTRFGQFAEPYLIDTGERGNMADLIPELAPIYKQLSLELPTMTKRAAVRLSLAEALETKVVPLSVDPWVRKLPRRLREARQTYSVGYRLADKKVLTMWDNKAGLSRLCPDDSREETARLTRRLVPALESEARRGARFTYAVFTVPNVAPGKLGHDMKKIFGRLRSVLLRRRPHVKGTKRAPRPLFFPGIRGWLAVLEAPLSRHRDWNLHVNVLLVHRGFVDWKELRALWHWNVQLKVVKGDGEALRASLREIIKYSAQAVAEKSDAKSKTGTASESGNDRHAATAVADRRGAKVDAPGHAKAARYSGASGEPTRTDGGGLAAGSSLDSPAAHQSDARCTCEIAGLTEKAAAVGPGGVVGLIAGSGDSSTPASQALPPLAAAPPMVEWSGPELLEWLLAFRKTRRTRTYGCLYRLPDPEKMDMSGFLWVGQGTWEGDRYRLRFSPLDSIPGDKSGRIGAADRYADFVRRLRGHPPPDIPVNSTSSAA